MADTPSAMPIPVVRRLIKYLAHLQQLKGGNTEWVSSQELGQALSVTDSTVRQDLGHLDFSGRANRGYEVEGLLKILTSALGLDTCRNAVIVGGGNLGRALALHEDFPSRGFRICGIFDVDPLLFGQEVGHLVVQSMSVLPKVVRNEGVDIGIVAVPASAARVATMALMAAGVRGVLNLACAHVTVPDDMAIVDARLVESLQELSCAIGVEKGAD